MTLGQLKNRQAYYERKQHLLNLICWAGFSFRDRRIVLGDRDLAGMADPLIADYLLFGRGSPFAIIRRLCNRATLPPC